MILVKEDIFRRRPILGNRILIPVRDDEETTPPVKVEPKQSDNPNKDIFRRRPILGNRILTPVRDDDFRKRPILGNPILGNPIRDKPVKVKEPVQNVPLPKVDPTPPKPEAPQEVNPMDAAMEEIRRAAEEREKFAQMMGGAFSDGTNMITGLSPEARDMIGLLMAQGIPANEAQDIARQKLGE